MAESYIKDALSANPTLYLDILEQFWRSATVEVTTLADGSSDYIIQCKVLDKDITVTTEVMNKALGLHQEQYSPLASESELVEFFDFIR